MVKNEWSYVSSLCMLPWLGQAQLYLPLCSKQKILYNIITHTMVVFSTFLEEDKTELVFVYDFIVEISPDCK